ncbi:hypothetical protein GXW82_26190 [Streptacidiphilus sp. 4-A2]|nr:hypothetical protein [Streptacidiphilus sp. 4-A2]
MLQHLRSGADLANHCVLSWAVTGPLDPVALAAAVADVHRRHGYLSARYESEDELLAVDSGEPVEFVRLAAEAPEQAERMLAEQLLQPFDLGAGQVWRAVLVREQPGERWLFAVAVHHAAFDGWSQHLLSGELGLAYSARRSGREPVFADPVPGPARTHRLLQELAAAVDLSAQRAYWARTLAGVPALDWPAPAGRAQDGPTRIEYPLTEELRAGADAARRQGTGLLAALADAVWRTVAEQTGQRDFALGVPVNLRGTQELPRRAA